MILSICLCLASFILLVAALRRSGASLGLPIAYLFALLFIHVPGAIAHLTGVGDLTPTIYTETGIWCTAVGAISFVFGVWWVHQRSIGKVLILFDSRRENFAKFCLIGGLIVTYALGMILAVPSVGAIVAKGGAVWVIGVLLGLRIAFWRAAPKEIAYWLAAMCIYPALTLLRTGFLSFGSTPVFIILAGLVIAPRQSWRVFAGISLVTLLVFHLFLSYFSNRDDIRDTVWGGADLQTRLESTMSIIKDFRVYNPENNEHLWALDQRLNQNYFVGLAAERIDEGVVDYLHGRSISEGLIALIPRAIWPEKPVFAGSPGIVMEMTGFIVNDTTSYGVGNVMEFHINFGFPGLIGGFFLLGLLFGCLDREAALAEREGNLGKLILYFLPGIAMIQPNGSIVELTGAGASALVAAVGWHWAWNHWDKSGISHFAGKAKLDAFRSAFTRLR